ncbi:MAG: hypothetical protein EZS28_025962, partial [Streblomastix strix]
MTTEAENFLLTLQNHFLWSILTTTDGLRPVPRICQLNHDPEFGFFYTTKSIYSKTPQIEKNPMATISIYPEKGSETVIAQVTIKITSDPKILEAGWNDGMYRYGYQKTNDPYYRVLLITVHSVTYGKDTYAGVPIDPSIYDKIAKEDLQPLPTGPFNAKEVDDIIKATFTTKKNTHLITKTGLQHDVRVVNVQYIEGVGLYSVTQIDSNKIKQIISNGNVALLTEDKEKWIQVVVDSFAKVSTSLELKKKVWNDQLKKFGFTGPEDEKISVILFTPRRVFHHTQETDCPVVYTTEPIQYDKDLLVLDRMRKLGQS